MTFVSERRTPGSLVYYKSRDCSIQFLQQRTFNLCFLTFLLGFVLLCDAISICLNPKTSAGSAVGRGMVIERVTIWKWQIRQDLKDWPDILNRVFSRLKFICTTHVLHFALIEKEASSKERLIDWALANFQIRSWDINCIRIHSCLAVLQWTKNRSVCVSAIGLNG